MNWKNAVCVVSGCALLIAAGVAAGRGITAAGNPNQRPLRVVTMDASWAKGYTSVSELRKDSDLVVSGTFGDVLRQSGDANGLMSRDYAFTVARVMCAKPGVPAQPGQVITIHQSGGIAAGVKQQISDDPLFAEGERAALFLVQDAPGAFHVVGGPGGRFKLTTADTVTPFNDETPRFAGTVSQLATALTAP